MIHSNEKYDKSITVVGLFILVASVFNHIIACIVTQVCLPCSRLTYNSLYCIVLIRHDLYFSISQYLIWRRLTPLNILFLAFLIFAESTVTIYCLRFWYFCFLIFLNFLKTANFATIAKNTRSQTNKNEATNDTTNDGCCVTWSLFGRGGTRRTLRGTG